MKIFPFAARTVSKEMAGQGILLARRVEIAGTTSQPESREIVRVTLAVCWSTTLEGLDGSQ